MSDDVFIQPLNLSDFNPSAPGDSPGFTQLVHDVLGDSASPLDGFDAAIGDVSTSVDLLDQALGEQDAALDAILVTLDTTNPAALDQSMQGYAGTIGDSAAIISDAQGLTPPALLQLPITLVTGGGIAGPPVQVSIDLGTVTVGGPRIVHALGNFVLDKHGVHGTDSATLVNGDSRIFRVDYTDRFSTDTVTRGRYVLTVTPAIAGTWVAQVNTHDTFHYGFAILTFSLTITP